MITDPGIFLNGFEALWWLLIEEIDGNGCACFVVEEQVDAEHAAFSFRSIEALNFEAVELGLEATVPAAVSRGKDEFETGYERLLRVFEAVFGQNFHLGICVEVFVGIGEHDPASRSHGNLL